MVEIEIEIAATRAGDHLLLLRGFGAEAVIAITISGEGIVAEVNISIKIARLRLRILGTMPAGLLDRKKASSWSSTLITCSSRVEGAKRER